MRIALTILSAGLCLAGQVPAHAALGGAPETGPSASARFNARLAHQSAAAYSLNTLNAADGGVVREYISPQGLVFAVAWQGPWRPDLNQLLGAARYQDYVAQARSQTQTSGRQPVRLVRSDLVIHSEGHAGAFTGLAYLPDQIPAGVSPADLH
ncbi:MAG: DUF2844 domain-containing protein [Curvibacter sp.]|nr:DUF2844 domain-containing protein [Curvibacter sp.]